MLEVNKMNNKNSSPLNSRINDIPAIPLSKVINQEQEVSNNVEIVSEVKEVKQTKLQTTIKKPKSKYCVDEKSEIKVYFNVFIDGDNVIVDDVSEEEEVPDKVEKHWFVFRIWNYFEKIDWKDSCMEYDLKNKIFLLNQKKYNELKFRMLLKSWSFSEQDISLSLLHVNNQLSDESLRVLLCQLHPNITTYMVRKMEMILE